MLRLTTLAAALALAAPAHAQENATAETDDCAFLVSAFEETYEGLRKEKGKMAEADHHQVMMYLQIQSNTVQLAEAVGCDVRPMVKIAREQLERYEDKDEGSRQRNN
ncbi:MAG: hypothetical protein V2I43_06695 [Parvularcula sp.]|jgi:hypothetical protein|nr:hypothetical protein [Parvularcula sp.]